MKNKPDIASVAAAIPDVEISEELGEGGFKVVYRAQVNGKEEALKLVRIPVDPNDDTVEEANRRRLYRELKLLGQCSCPYLVKLGTVKPTDISIGAYQYTYYSEEVIPGDNLRTLIEAGHRPTQQEIATVGSYLLAVVEELAGLDTIHRDIKPLNIMATNDANRAYVLLDLGIAFVVGGTNLTMDSQAIPGSRYYIAPEMLDVNFRQSLSYRADLYAIGLTLYEFASGENPYKSPDDPVWTTMYRIKHQKPPALAEFRPDFDASLCGLIDQLIKKLPALRPANLAQLKKRMEEFK